MYFSLAEIRLFAGDFAPRGWAFCDGSLILARDNTPLLSLLGNAFGGDAQTNFGLPRLADLDGGNGGKVRYIICTSGSWPATMDGYIGAVRLFAGINPPRGWLPCDGRTVPVSQDDINSLRLLQVLGTNYGGNGTTSVGLPRLTPHPQAIQAFGTSVPQYLICTQGQFARPINQNGGIEAATEDYVGEVVSFAGNYLPQGLLPAQGMTLPINFNQALFSVLGPRFTATPNSTTFQLPLLSTLPAENGPPVALLVATAGYYPSRG